MSYQFINEVNPKKIGKLSNPEQAEAVIEEIAALAEQTTPAPRDQVGQWLGVLSGADIVAQKVKSGKDTIEVYPGGKGSPDRIFITVVGGVVTVVAVGEASH